MASIIPVTQEAKPEISRPDFVNSDYEKYLEYEKKLNEERIQSNGEQNTNNAN